MIKVNIRIVKNETSGTRLAVGHRLTTLTALLPSGMPTFRVYVLKAEH